MLQQGQFQSDQTTFRHIRLCANKFIKEYKVDFLRLSPSFKFIRFGERGGRGDSKIMPNVSQNSIYTITW